MLFRFLRLKGAPSDRIETEIAQAADVLRTRLGAAARWFAFPFGDIGSIDAPALRIAGRYHELCRSGVRGPNGFAGQPSGTVVTRWTWSGRPSNARTSGSQRLWNVENTDPSPSERATSTASIVLRGTPALELVINKRSCTRRHHVPQTENQHRQRNRLGIKRRSDIQV